MKWLAQRRCPIKGRHYSSVGSLMNVLFLRDLKLHARKIQTYKQDGYQATEGHHWETLVATSSYTGAAGRVSRFSPLWPDVPFLAKAPLWCDTLTFSCSHIYLILGETEKLAGWEETLCTEESSHFLEPPPGGGGELVTSYPAGESSGSRAQHQDICLLAHSQAVLGTTVVYLTPLASFLVVFTK